MPYTVPPVISASTLLGATQVDIYGDDLIDLEGRSRAPLVPFESAPLADHYASAADNEPSWRGFMVHKYITSASEHLRVAYYLDMTLSGSNGTPVVQFMSGNTVLHSVDVTTTTTASSFALPTVNWLDGRHTQCNVRLQNAVNTDGGGTATATGTLRYLEQIKLDSDNYAAFRAGRFADGDTTTVGSDFATLRDNIIELDALAAGGRGAFRARVGVSDYQWLGGPYAQSSVELFDGYTRCNRGGGVYMAWAVAHSGRDTSKSLWYKVTYNGSEVGVIEHKSTATSRDQYAATQQFDLDKVDISASTLNVAAEAGYANIPYNAYVPITVTACTNSTTEHTGYFSPALLYLAEVPSASDTGWVTPGDHAEGGSVLGNTIGQSASMLLETLADNVELLAGDEGGSGFATLNVAASNGMASIGAARCIYRFPIQRMGRQPYGIAAADVVEAPGGVINPLDASGKVVQRLYSIHTGDTIIVRGCNARLKYGPSASPLVQSIEDYDTLSASYDEIDANSVDGLRVGMVYYAEAEIPTDPESGRPVGDLPEQLDYLEER